MKEEIKQNNSAQGKSERGEVKSSVDGASRMKPIISGGNTTKSTQKSKTEK